MLDIPDIPILSHARPKAQSLDAYNYGKVDKAIHDRDSNTLSTGGTVFDELACMKGALASLDRCNMRSREKQLRSQTIEA